MSRNRADKWTAGEIALGGVFAVVVLLVLCGVAIAVSATVIFIRHATGGC